MRGLIAESFGLRISSQFLDAPLHLGRWRGDAPILILIWASVSMTMEDVIAIILSTTDVM